MDQVSNHLHGYLRLSGPARQQAPTGQDSQEDNVEALQHQLAAALREGGADTMFGLIGGGNFGLAGSFRGLGGRYLGLRHEMNAVAAADSYARTTGRLGLATVTQGPGLTHTLTALVEAAKSHSPMLILAADSALGDRVSNQSVDQAAIAAAAGTGYLRWRRGTPVAAFAGQAARQAESERRPVLVGFPSNLAVDPGDAAHRTGPIRRDAPVARAHVPEIDVAAIGKLLAEAKRPTILAGRGCHLRDAGPALAKLAEHLGAVLTTTVMANGLFYGHPLDAGISGGFGDDHGSRLLAETDVLVAVGAALTMWTTRHGELYGRARIVQIDDRPDAFGRYTPVNYALLADAGLAAEELHAHVLRMVSPQPQRGARVAEYLAARDSGPGNAVAPDGRMDPRALTAALDDVLPIERCVTVDGGHFSGWPVMHLRADSPQGLLYPHGFQSIGLGLGSVVGVAVARPGRVPVLAVGDGGLLMSLGELDTLLSERIPALVVVYNDSAYGAELHAFASSPDVDLAHLPERDFAAIFAAMGGRAETIAKPDDLCCVQSWLRDRSGPLLLDCKVSRQVVAPWLRFVFGGDHEDARYRHEGAE
jgi:thiamine pyrophosphate-dependent acetolactate synthase large subunit-like protein